MRRSAAALSDLGPASGLRSATLRDVAGMATMIDRFAAQGRMLPKSAAELARCR